MTDYAISAGISFHDVKRVTLNQYMPDNDQCLCLKLHGATGLTSEVSLFGLPPATAAKIADFFRDLYAPAPIDAPAADTTPAVEVAP